MYLLFLAASGGAIGAAARFLINRALVGPQIIGGAVVFPSATMTVNVAGGFLMGFLVVFIGERLGGSVEWRTFFATGILGGFTTFSAFSLDMFNLITDGGLSVRFIAYTIGSVVLAFAALLGGMALARTVLA
jgi:fluoride exporter